MKNQVAVSTRVAAIFAAIVGLFAAAPAFAITEECPTWFPDFQCDRSGRYDGFVMPISHPYLFEDPFITTGINLVGIWHDYPRDSVMNGGHAWVVAGQARIALTDRLAFIATKDGYMWSKPGLRVINNEDGFLNIAGGLKYALIDDRENNFILSPRLVIEVPTGNDDVYSGRGDGIAITGVSSAYRIGDLNIMGDIGFQVPFNRNKQSTSLLYHMHLSYTLMKHFVPLIELNGHHYMDSGNGGTKVDVRGTGKISLGDLGLNGFEAVDVTNLGQKGVAGNDLVTMAFGARFPINKHVSMGAAYEFPVTNREDIFNQRVTWSINFEY